MSLYGDWNRFKRHIETLPQRLERRLEMVTGKIAVLLHREWVNGIKHNTLGLDQNAPLTRESKKSSSPLIDHGDLLGNIKTHKTAGKWFVGILKNAKTDSGDSLVNVALTLEYGSDGPIRPKKGKYLAVSVTRVASRAGSPWSYPGHLTFLDDKRTPGAVFVDFETEEIQWVLLKEVTIPPRPAMRHVYNKFLPKARKMYADAIRAEVYG